MTAQEQAVQAFEDADKEYRALQERLTSGEIISDIWDPNVDKMVQEFRGFISALTDAIEKRNNSIKQVGDVMRPLVMMDPAKQRGSTGKPTVLTVGPFKATSVTTRFFDQRDLFDQCRKAGLEERLLSLTTIDKDGKEKKLVEQVYEIDFEGVAGWLRANKLENILEHAYDEKEKTPQVKGPKPVIFLGEAKEK